VARNLAARPDDGPLLNLDERVDARLRPDPATVKVDVLGVMEDDASSSTTSGEILK